MYALEIASEPVYFFAGCHASTTNLFQIHILPLPCWARGLANLNMIIQEINERTMPFAKFGRHGSGGVSRYTERHRIHSVQLCDSSSSSSCCFCCGVTQTDSQPTAVFYGSRMSGRQNMSYKMYMSVQVLPQSCPLTGIQRVVASLQLLR